MRLFVALVGLVLQMSGAIMFWNLENYFDPFDDPLTVDEDFTPRGKKHWSWKLFVQKRNGIAKTILAAADACDGAEPDIVCLAEVENFMVLHQLVEETPLLKLDYGIVHRNSPDRRGIDVAMIYRKSRVRILAVDSLRISGGAPTRDILYIKCLRNISSGTQPTDTLHLLVNHWPSKRGGAEASASRRKSAAAVLMRAVDSILTLSPSADVIVTGDFNDIPANVAPLLPAPLLRPVEAHLPEGIGGTIKYRGVWEQIDQFYVSGHAERKYPRMLVFAPEFLLEPDTQYTGVRPRRTFLGPRWHEGLSDHLPILLVHSPSPAD